MKHFWSTRILRLVPMVIMLYHISAYFFFMVKTEYFVPHSFSWFLNLYTSPLYFLFKPWNSLLEQFGQLEVYNSIVAPSFLAVIGIGVIYSISCHLFAVAFLKLWHLVIR